MLRLPTRVVHSVLLGAASGLLKQSPPSAGDMLVEAAEHRDLRTAESQSWAEAGAPTHSVYSRSKQLLHSAICPTIAGPG